MGKIVTNQDLNQLELAGIWVTTLLLLLGINNSVFCTSFCEHGIKLALAHSLDPVVTTRITRPVTG